MNKLFLPQITPTGILDDNDILNSSMDILSPQRVKERKQLGDLNTKTGLKRYFIRNDIQNDTQLMYIVQCSYISIFRFDGFEQGLNNFHVQAKSIGGSENLRRSPPNKKTKKASKDLVLESPKAFKDNKFGESADKFLFLGELHVS